MSLDWDLPIAATGERTRCQDRPTTQRMNEHRTSNSIEDRTRTSSIGDRITPTTPLKFSPIVHQSRRQHSGTPSRLDRRHIRKSADHSSQSDRRTSPNARSREKFHLGPAELFLITVTLLVTVTQGAPQILFNKPGTTPGMDIFVSSAAPPTRSDDRLTMQFTGIMENRLQVR